MISRCINLRLSFFLLAFNPLLLEVAAVSPTTFSTTAIFPNDQVNQTRQCYTSSGYANTEQTLHCPSLYNIDVTVTISFKEKVQITCLAEYNLTDINASVGEVKRFKSYDCNIMDDLRQVFNRWGIKNTRSWYIRHGSNKDFVLRKAYFDQIDVIAVQEIFIANSNIIGVEADAFQDFIGLENISIVGNKVQALPDFGYLKSLTLIDFGDNRISKLPEQLANANLKVLLLWSNRITALNESFFTNTPRIKSLELSNNKIRNLTEQLISPLWDLRKISLSGNDFSEVPANFFRNNTRLNEIRLESLNMVSLPENIFAGLFDLTTVKLTNNLLENISETVFADQANIENLYLSNNRLKILPDNIFKNFGKIQLLKLSNNQLSKWNNTLSEGVKSLKMLDLSDNNFVRIEATFFKSFQNLQQLNLKRNKISYIDLNAFSHMREMDYLDLSYNDLSYDSDDITFIDGLKSVKNLVLAHNNLQSVPNNIEVKVRKLDVSNNNIRNVDLQQLINLDSVDLRHNEIDEIDFRSLDILFRVNAFQENSRKVEINLSNNTIDCGCEVFNLIEFFDGSYKYKEIYNKILIAGNLPCRNPPNMVGRSVNTLKSAQFTCDYSKIYTCPKECACELYPKHQSYNVSCSNRNLQKLPVIGPFVAVNYRNGYNVDGMFSIKKLHVDLSNNSIANLTSRDSSYVNVSELYLSDNQLSLVSWLPKHLEVLELNDNDLENLDYGAISVLNNSKTLKRLTLHDNQWNCNCKLLNFTRLLKSEYLKIPLDEKILCTDGQKVVGLVEGDLCGFENQAALIAVGICFFIFLVMIGVALILYYKYEYEVKVWLYSKPLFMRFVTEEELDKDKEYDAFLSYSHKDEEFIIKELLPELESGSNPYKLCIHARDWIVGEFITKQIIDSVEKSRRTIIVLSPHFLESEWAQMEFRTAHTRAMDERRNRLIVILYGDVNPDAIEDPELKAYLTTNTYVKWGDPWFWKKLKYVLPHKKGEHNNNIDVNNGKKKMRNKRMENIMVTIDKMDLIHAPATPNIGTPPAISIDPLLIKGSALGLKNNSNTTTPPAESGIITTMTC